MTEDTKRRVLLLFALVLLATALVAASLPQLELKPGIPPPPVEKGSFAAAQPGDENLALFKVNTFFLTVLAIAAAALLAVMIIRALRGFSWKQLLKTLFQYLFTLLIIFAILAAVIYLLPTGPAPDLPPIPPPPPPEIITAPLGATPPILLWIVGIILALSAAAFAAWFYLSSRRKPSGEDIFLFEAEKARRDLLSGGDLKEIIVRCYQQMSQVLQEERGIEREVYMTTGEFERLLTEKGYPPVPVHQLTRLFEAVRYGRSQPGPQDEQTAVASLDAIIRFSRQEGAAG
jgi:hypothetical protein